MTFLSFLAMYAVMYAMVDKWADVHLSLSRAYMAALMAAPMVLLELWLMKSMYPDKRMNAILAGLAVVAGVALWVAIRTEAGVGDRQFLKAMIPHHSGAVLMCEQSSLSDAEIVALCKSIVESQQREIDQMEAILRRLGGGPAG